MVWPRAMTLSWRKGLLLGLLAIVLAGAGWWLLNPHGDAAEPSEPEIVNAVAQAMLDSPWNDASYPAYCLLINNTAEVPQALRAPNGSRLLPGDQCSMSPEGGVIVTTTGEPALRLRIGPQTCSVIGNRCVVSASATYGNLGANGMEYQVDWQGGKWLVTESWETWVS